MKLLIAIPSYDSMRAEFVQSLMSLVRWCSGNGIDHEVKIITGTLVYLARDRLAKHAVNKEFSHVLWLDSDMVFSENLLDDLIFCGKDIVCGKFISRHSPYVSCIFKSIDPVERIDPKDITGSAFEVAACGFGAVFMKAQVLRDVLISHGGECFMPIKNLGEDVAFCRRARECGYKIYCEPTARVGHVGTLTIWPEDGEKLRRDIQGIEGMVI